MHVGCRLPGCKWMGGGGTQIEEGELLHSSGAGRSCGGGDAGPACIDSPFRPSPVAVR